MAIRAAAAAIFISAAWLLGASVSLAAPLVAPCTELTVTSVECDPVNSTNPLPVSPNSYPAGSTPITGNGTGTTGAVVGTLAAAAAKLTYISADLRSRLSVAPLQSAPLPSRGSSAPAWSITLHPRQPEPSSPRPSRPAFQAAP
jgi:hypothetical protein